MYREDAIGAEGIDSGTVIMAATYARAILTATSCQGRRPPSRRESSVVVTPSTAARNYTLALMPLVRHRTAVNTVTPTTSSRA